MKEAVISPWLYGYIKQRGDSMNVTVRFSLHG